MKAILFDLDGTLTQHKSPLEESARKTLDALSEKYKLHVDLDAKVEDITVGMQQRVEILKMLSSRYEGAPEFAKIRR